MLQRITAVALQTSAFDLKASIPMHNMFTKMYILDKMHYNMLKIAAEFSFISYMLYIVMYFCTTGRYMCAISIIYATKVKLRESVKNRVSP